MLFRDEAMGTWAESTGNCELYTCSGAAQELSSRSYFFLLGPDRSYCTYRKCTYLAVWGGPGRVSLDAWGKSHLAPHWSRTRIPHFCGSSIPLSHQLIVAAGSSCQLF